VDRQTPLASNLQINLQNRKISKWVITTRLNVLEIKNQNHRYKNLPEKLNRTKWLQV